MFISDTERAVSSTLHATKETRVSSAVTPVCPLTKSTKPVSTQTKSWIAYSKKDIVLTILTKNHIDNTIFTGDFVKTEICRIPLLKLMLHRGTFNCDIHISSFNNILNF